MATVSTAKYQWASFLWRITFSWSAQSHYLKQLLLRIKSQIKKRWKLHQREESQSENKKANKKLWKRRRLLEWRRSSPMLGRFWLKSTCRRVILRKSWSATTSWSCSSKERCNVVKKNWNSLRKESAQWCYWKNNQHLHNFTCMWNELAEVVSSLTGMVLKSNQRGNSTKKKSKSHKGLMTATARKSQSAKNKVMIQVP